MLKSSASDYSDAYILVKGTITVAGKEVDVTATATDRNEKQVIFRNCASFNDCIIKTNNTKVDNTKDLDVAMPM